MPTPPPDSPYRERLQDLPAEVAQALLAAGVRRQWRRGEVLMRQGEAVDSLLVALQGRLSASLAHADGRDTLLRWLDDGELVGLPAVLAGMPATVSIQAQGAAATLHIARAEVVAVLRRLPEGAIGVAVLLSRRLGELFRYVEQSSARPLADRVAYALERLARSRGEPDGPGRVRLKITQADLAAAAGASRQRVHLALQWLRAQGRVQLGYGTVTLLAPPQAPKP